MFHPIPRNLVLEYRYNKRVRICDFISLLIIMSLTLRLRPLEFDRGRCTTSVLFTFKFKFDSPGRNSIPGNLTAILSDIDTDMQHVCS